MSAFFPSRIHGEAFLNRPVKALEQSIDARDAMAALKKVNYHKVNYYKLKTYLAAKKKAP